MGNPAYCFFERKFITKFSYDLICLDFEEDSIISRNGKKTVGSGILQEFYLVLPSYCFLEKKCIKKLLWTQLGLDFRSDINKSEKEFNL